MQIICPTCNAVFRIPANKLPQKKILTACRKCGGKIVVDSTPGEQWAQTMPAEAYPLAAASPSEQKVQSNTSSRAWTEAELALVNDYPELRELNSQNFDYGEIFTPNKKGTYKSRQNKLRAKVLKAVHAVAGKMLRDGENVIRVGKGIAYYPSEIFLGNGYLTMMYNHYAILATDQRLLFKNINSRISRPTHYFFQIPYRDTKKVRKGLFGNSIVLYRFHGKRRVFNGMKRYMSKEFQQIIEEVKTSMQDVQPASAPLENLCPSCFMPLAKNLPQCPKCRVAFKKAKTALLKSLFLPGWGDVYLGHRPLGILELLGSLAVWTVVISAGLMGDQQNLILALIVLVLYNGFDGLLTHHMAKKGYSAAVE